MVTIIVAKKQFIKSNEARVLVFLSQVDSPLKYTQKISSKLGIDYAYLCRSLADMKEKGWVKKIKRENRTFYELADRAPLEKAIVVVLEGKNAKN
tara:strand:+ start:1746 stop:2030 length:285 start_codon:yes stop_codon:yes gene_type:complete